MKPTKYSGTIYLALMLLLACNGNTQAADYDEAVFTPVTRLDIRLNPEKFLDKSIRVSGMFEFRDEDSQRFRLCDDTYNSCIQIYYGDVSREAEKRLILETREVSISGREVVVYGYLKKYRDGSGLYIHAVGFRKAEEGAAPPTAAPAAPSSPRSTPTPPSQTPPQGGSASLPGATDSSAVTVAAVCPKGQLGEFHPGTKCTGYYDDKGLVDIQVAGKATSKEYVSTKSLVHAGVDIAALEGSDVFPIADGTVDDVISSEKDPNFGTLGYMVLIEHKNKLNAKPTYSLYLHLNEKPSVAVGVTVVAGKTLLGKVGASGAAFGPHLHLEVRHFAGRFSPKWKNIYGVERPSSEATFDEKDFQENWTNPEGVTASSVTGTSGNANPSPQETRTLAQQLSELLEPPRAPEQPDKVFSDEKSGVTVSYPAEFKASKEQRPVIAFFLAPSTGGSEQYRPKISVTCAPTPLLNRNLSLEFAVNDTIAGTRSALTDASITGPFKTTLAGVEAQMFVATGKEEGLLRQKAVTVAVCRKHVLGVILHATPETFQKYWDAYKRVCNSYVLR